MTVHDVGKFEGRQYIVTEYIDGGTPAGLVENQKRLGGKLSKYSAAWPAGWLLLTMPGSIIAALKQWTRRTRLSRDFGERCRRSIPFPGVQENSEIVLIDRKRSRFNL